MDSKDVTYLFFQRDYDNAAEDLSHPSIQTTTRIVQHGSGVRDGSVPPRSLRAGSLPPRSLRAGSVAPSSGGIVIATATPTRCNFLGRLQPPTTSTSVRRVIYRPPAHGSSGSSITHDTSLRRTSSSNRLPLLDLTDDAADDHHQMTSDRKKIDHIRRASITVATATPAEQQHRTKLARDLLIYRADDFKSGDRHGPGVVPAAAAAVTADYGLSNGFKPASSYTGRSTAITQRRASVSGPPTSRFSEDAGGVDRSCRPVRKTLSPDEDFKMLTQSTKREYIGDLQSKMNSAREQMSRHRSMLDRYLPFNLEPTNDVQYEVENKVNELAYRIPQLDRARRVTRSEDRTIVDARPSSLVTPYKPLPKTTKIDIAPLPPLRNSFTPKISDVRKRARQVLCKVKGDPRYFDL